MLVTALEWKAGKGYRKWDRLLSYVIS